ncbi:putative Glutaryl 7-aminocephalosporanic acid acylase [Candidatus Sulfopaludibacter sp. SbA6]|nr:putative Glutaryl 7-aminocephalosporanic acid acylase [Candidatus Sulfopaludibacter sp. SbA6]
MKRSALILALSTVLCAAEKVEILRDEYGVPHIFAATAAGAAFGSGYAQAEDRLEEMLRNYRKAEGTMSEAFGPEFVFHDYRQRVWRHRQVAQEHYKDLDPKLRAICEAFQAGVRKFMQEHPEQVPAWAPKLEPWQIIALGRYIIWGWPEGEAGGDLKRIGIDPDPVAYHGSNEMLLAPFRTAMHAPIAVVDPHLSWYGEFRFYEMRIYGGELSFSGAAILGLPFPSLGHNRYLSIAMTTGGPDTSDAYEEEVKDGKYRFKDEWRPLDVRTERIGVKVGGEIQWQDVRIESTHHGPIVAHKDGKAYSLAIPYANEFQLLDTSWHIATAHNLAEAKKALAGLQLMAQNIMIGTVDGDIYYVRNGRVPIRPAGCDTSKPMSGPAGQCEWQGLHPFEDLVQISNPPQGYMQNCNVSPFAMMKDSPLVPEKWAAHPYIYNDSRRPPHQRAAMMVDLLDAARSVTAEQMTGIAFSPEVWHAELWQERIRRAAATGQSASELGRMLAQWNHRSDADSRAALGYYLFKTAMGLAGRAVDPPDSLTDEAVRGALAKAEQRLRSEFPPDAVFGTLFRVGRQGGSRTWPVSGGTLAEAGMATPRAISFSKVGNEMVGHSGQTSTQIVVLTKPPQSYMVIPLGESDHPDSGHWDDQAEKLFSKGRAKPTYFANRKELEKHVKGKKELTF